MWGLGKCLHTQILQLERGTWLRSGREWGGAVGEGKRDRFSSQVLSRPALSLSHHDFLRSLETAAPTTPSRWGLEVPSEDHSVTPLLLSVDGQGECPGILSPSSSPIPKPSPGLGHPYLGSE